MRVPLLIGRRLVGALVSLLTVLVFNFFLFNVLSSDPIKALVRNRHLDAAAQAHLRHEFGYDQSLWRQFVAYMQQLLLHHNLGISTTYTQPVWSVISTRIWPTVLLVGVSTLLSSLIGTWIGIKGAWERNGRFDKISNGVSVTLYAMPEFWLGLVLVMMIMFGRVYGAVIAALIFALCTATKLPFMQSIIFTVVLVLVLGVVRPHILKITSAITERAIALQQSLKARFSRRGSA